METNQTHPCVLASFLPFFLTSFTRAFRPSFPSSIFRHPSSFLGLCAISFLLPSICYDPLCFVPPFLSYLAWILLSIRPYLLVSFRHHRSLTSRGRSSFWHPPFHTVLDSFLPSIRPSYDILSPAVMKSSFLSYILDSSSIHPSVLAAILRPPPDNIVSFISS